MNTKNNFFFYHSGGIGDFISILPTIKFLKENNSDKHFILLGKKETACIAHNHKYFDEILDVNEKRWANLFNFPSILDSTILPILKSCNTAYIWTSSTEMKEHLIEYNVKDITQINPFPATDISIYNYNFEAIKHKYPNAKIDYIDILLNENDFIDVEHFKIKDKRTAIIHPGSGGASKNLSLERFKEFSVLLKIKGYNVLWILGNAELDRNLEDDIKNETVITNLSLRKLSALFKLCNIYIGNDSGISHLAAACGIMTYVFFINSNPIIWKPFGNNVRVLGIKNNYWDFIK